MLVPQPAQWYQVEQIKIILIGLIGTREHLCVNQRDAGKERENYLQLTTRSTGVRQTSGVIFTHLLGWSRCDGSTLMDPPVPDMPDILVTFIQMLIGTTCLRSLLRSRCFSVTLVATADVVGLFVVNSMLGGT